MCAERHCRLVDVNAGMVHRQGALNAARNEASAANLTTWPITSALLAFAVFGVLAVSHLDGLCFHKLLISGHIWQYALVSG